MLEAAGYPDRKGALTAVAAKVGAPAMTISRWFNARNNPAPNDVVTEKRLELKDMLRAEIDGALAAMPGQRIEATYRDLGTVAAILIDKLQLIEGKATERVELSGLSDDERAERAARLLNAARARRDGRAADGEFIH